MENSAESLKFKVIASTKLLAMVRERIRETAHKAGVPEKIINQVVLAADEAVTNVIRHAYKNDGISEVEIEIKIDKSKIQIVIKDTAEYFDPTQYPMPDIKKHLEVGKKSGLGIFLMRKIMDEVIHRCANGKANELVLVKYVDPDREGSDGEIRDRNANTR